jgi:dTDP-glucose 4,6-dehydratase
MRLNDGRALPTFMTQALLGKDITIFGDGSQTRSFTFVSDLVDGIYRLAKSQETEPTNIGNPREMSIREFAQKVRDLTGTKSKVVERPLPVDDPKVRQPDITKARAKLGWEPKVSLEEGLKLTLPDFERRLRAAGGTPPK